MSTDGYGKATRGLKLDDEMQKFRQSTNEHDVE